LGSTKVIKNFDSTKLRVKYFRAKLKKNCQSPEWNGSQITQFAKHSFPHQLRDASEEYIKCNLTRNPLEGIFKLDRPEKGCYEFNYAL
jgi:hypothetical protein